MKITHERAAEVLCPAKQLKAGCVTVDCAAWRWLREKETTAYLDAVQAHMLVNSEQNFGKAASAVWAETHGAYEHTEGYCGLGGKPE